MCLKSLEVNLCNLNGWGHGSWDLSLHIGFQVPSPKYDMDVCMATLSGGETWDLCWELGLSFSSTQLSTQVLRFFAQNNQDPTLVINNHIWWFFKAQKLGHILHPILHNYSEVTSKTPITNSNNSYVKLEITSIITYECCFPTWHIFLVYHEI